MDHRRTRAEFLKTLFLEGNTVVGDAGFSQRDICETILSGHREYLVLVKDSQPTLHKEAIQAFVISEGPVFKLNTGPPMPNARRVKQGGRLPRSRRAVVALNAAR